MKVEISSDHHLFTEEETSLQCHKQAEKKSCLCVHDSFPHPTINQNIPGILEAHQVTDSSAPFCTVCRLSLPTCDRQALREGKIPPQRAP